MPDLWSKIYKFINKDDKRALDEENVEFNGPSLPTEVRVAVRHPRSFAEGVYCCFSKSRPSGGGKFRRGVPVEIAQRLVDYLCGATYVLNGNMEKVGTSIFLFTPMDVDIHARDLFGLDEK